MSKYPGAQALHHQGARYVLGRTGDAYAIWDRQSGGRPVRTFSHDVSGWEQAWQTFQELEGGSTAGRVDFTLGRPAHVRAMRVGQVLDAAISLYRANAATLLSLMALVIVPYTILQYVLIRATVTFVEVEGLLLFETEGDLLTFNILTVVFGLGFFVFVTPLLTGAVVDVAARAHLGARPTAGEALRAAFPKLLSILLVSVLVALAVMGGFILLIVPGFILLVRFVFAPAIVMLEDRRGRAALRRSGQLSTGLGWKIFGAILLSGVLAAIASAILALPLTFAGAALGGFAGTGWMLSALGEMLAQVLVTPFTSLVIVMLYFDARVRKEGLDLQLMAAEVGTPPPTDEG